MPKLDLRVIGHVAADVPWRPKGAAAYSLATRKLAILQGQREREMVDLARALTASLARYRKAHPPMTGDGLQPTDSGKRVKPERGKRGDGFLPVNRLPASKLHRHSARCVVPLTEHRYYPETGESGPIPGWFRCKVLSPSSGEYGAGYLHEHRTKRGRTFLASHLRSVPCPFDL